MRGLLLSLDLGSDEWCEIVDPHREPEHAGWVTPAAPMVSSPSTSALQ